MRKVNILLLFLIFTFSISFAQNTFIKELGYPMIWEPQVVSTPDDGFLIFGGKQSPSKVVSLLSKFDKCGNAVWAYEFDNASINIVGSNFMSTNNQGQIFILLKRVVSNADEYGILSVDKDGSFLWCKNFSDSNFIYKINSILVADDGNIMAFGTTRQGGSTRMMSAKISTLGTVLWSYQYSGLYGADMAIPTQDSGVLIRSVGSFTKLNIDGDVEWNTSFVNGYPYFSKAPVEVDDGYVFTRKDSSTSKIVFHKLDKWGRVQWGGGLVSSEKGNEPQLRPLPNGNFVAGFTKFILPTNNVSTLVEFDKDLNVIKQNSLNFNSTQIYVSNYVSVENKNLIVVGTSKVSNPSTVIFGKLNMNYKSGCDTSVTITFTQKSEWDTSYISAPRAIGLTMKVSTVLLSPVSLNFIDICNNNLPTVIDLGSDTIVCKGSIITLKNISSSTFDTFLWSTGESSESISVNTAGTYWVTASYSCDGNSFSDTINVDVTVVPNPHLITDTVLCDSNILLDATVPNGQYLWQDSSALSAFLVSTSGTYTVEITQNNCTDTFVSNIFECVVMDSFTLFIPNVFTPNNDGVNDYFGVVYDGNEDVSIEVYNRWGVLLFQSSRKEFSWDGTLSGELSSDGVYFYVIQIGEEKHQGSLTLMR